MTINNHPIAGRMPLFQQWARQAIRDDWKTNTRRPIKAGMVQYCEQDSLGGGDHIENGILHYRVQTAVDDCTRFEVKAPWKVGGIRVITEPLQRLGGLAWYADPENPGAEIEDEILHYTEKRHITYYGGRRSGKSFSIKRAADAIGRFNPVISNQTGKQLEWRWKRDTLPAIHMPHEAARMLCRVTEVRAERLQDISEEAQKAEGIIIPSVWYVNGNKRTRFGTLWDLIYLKRGYSWDSNPWVWVLVWERVT